MTQASAFRATAFAACVVGWVAGVFAAAPAVGPKSLNVLFIVVDDLNLALGCYGDPVAQTPQIDRLAARGVRFDRAYAQYPLCNPSRVSFLSGRRPETSGVYILSTPARTALPDAVMLPQFFRQQGYLSAGAGKIFHNTKVNDEASWDSYDDRPASDPEEIAAIEARYGSAGKPGDGRPAFHVLSSDGAGTRDGRNVRTILRIMAEQHATGRPFFLAAGLHLPHLPWTAPKKFFDLYPPGSLTPKPEPAMVDVPPIALQTELSGFAQPDSREAAMRGYYASVSFTDAHVGMLLDGLDRLDLWKTTVVVLISDHGFHLGDHGGLWAKLSAFDAATRVPMIVAGAGVPAGKVVAEPVELLDVFPTLVELGGFAPLPGLEGRSLVAAMRGRPPTGFRPASSMVYHYDQAKKSDVLGRTVIAAEWRYTEWAGGAAGRELYWRADDPMEYRNRAGDPKLVAALNAGAAYLLNAPSPKPGPANRPRALLEAARKNP